MQKTEAAPTPESAAGFNVLESVVFDPQSDSLEMLGRRDPDGPEPIPYRQALAEALSFPGPQFSLDSDFSRFTRAHIGDRSLPELLFAGDALTPFARVTLKILDVPPPAPPTRAQYTAALLRQAGFGLAADLREAVQEEAGRLSGATLTRWIEILRLVPDFEQFRSATRGDASSDPEAADAFYLRLLRGLAGSLEGSGPDVASLYRQARNAGIAPDEALRRGLGAYLDGYDALLVRAVRILLERRGQPAVIYSSEELRVAFGSAPVSRPKFMKLDAATQLGRLLFEGDYALKSVPFDSRLGEIPGYRTFPSWADAYIDRSDLGTSRETRYWITVDSVEIRESTDGLVATVGPVRMRVESRTKGVDEPWSAERVDPVTQAYADLLTEQFDGIAARVPELQRLREAAKAIAVANWLRGKGRRPDLGAEPAAWRAPAEVSGFLAMMPYLRQGMVLWGVWPSGGVDFDFGSRIVITQDPSLTTASVRTDALAGAERRRRLLGPVEARGLFQPWALALRTRIEADVHEANRTWTLLTGLQSARDAVGTLNTYLLETQRLQAGALRELGAAAIDAASQLLALDAGVARMSAADRAEVGGYVGDSLPPVGRLGALAREVGPRVEALRPETYTGFRPARADELARVAEDAALRELQDGLRAWDGALRAMYERQPDLFDRLLASARSARAFLSAAARADIARQLYEERTRVLADLLPNVGVPSLTNPALEAILERQLAVIETERRDLDAMRG
jgi:hypothetical protein